MVNIRLNTKQVFYILNEFTKRQQLVQNITIQLNTNINVTSIYVLNSFFIGVLHFLKLYGSSVLFPQRKLLALKLLHSWGFFRRFIRFEKWFLKQLIFFSLP